MSTAPDILTRIVAHKREELEARKKLLSPVDLERRCEGVSRNGASFLATLHKHDLHVIAEIKRRSPSAGAIADLPDPSVQAQAYEQGGAAAISVLTDKKFFGGSLEDLACVRRVTGLPLLRKDFVIDPYQIHEAAQAGADLILLIAAILEPVQAAELASLAATYGLAVLFEIHSLAEYEPFADQNWPLIGINNRNLHTFVTDRRTSLTVRPALPKEVRIISESGFADAVDFDPFCGIVDGFLVGEALSGSVDPAATLTRWRNHWALRS